jgi:hypothetical protein
MSRTQSLSGVPAIRPLFSQTWVLLSLCVFGFSFAPPTHAELNGSLSSIDVDRDYVAGTLNTTTRFGCTVSQITDRNGTLVREYVSPTDRVFGIAWEGHFVPEMQHFLGALFQAYSTAARTEHAAHGWREPLLIHTPALVFEAGGHMGWYYGRAYVPSEIPNDFPIEEIR